MTNHNDAINRALERVPREYVVGPTLFNDQALRTILTDLAAEKLEEGKAIGRAQAQKFIASMGQRQAEAHLAAVVDGIQRIADHIHEPCEIALQQQLFDLVDLARGEGDDHDRVYNAQLRKWGDEGGEQDTMTLPCEAEAATREDAGPATPDAPQITMHAYEADTYGECKHCGYGPEHPCHGETGRRPVAAGHIDWRAWVNERAMDSLDADMEGGDFIRVGEVLELAELLIRAEAKLYTDSQVGPEHPCHGNASRDDVTKPQQSPASDGGLDEIVRDCFDSLNPMACGDPQNDMDYIRAACIRARELAEQASEIHYWRSRLLDAERKLAAVRAWADDQVQEYHADLEQLGTILDSKEAE